MLAEMTTTIGINILSTKISSLIDSKISIKEWEKIFIGVGEKTPFGRFNTFLKTAELSHLDLLIKLFNYSYSNVEQSDRRRTIRSIAIASFKEIRENITNQDELNDLIENITILAKNNHVYLYTIIREIQESYIKRNNKFFNIDSILKLTE